MTIGGINVNDKGKIGSYLDFLLIDLISIAASFIASYRIKFGDFGFVNSSAWTPLLFIVCLLNAFSTSVHQQFTTRRS